MEEFEIDGVTYRAERLTAMKQGHVSRRIAPIIPSLLPIAMQVMKAMAADDAKTLSAAQESRILALLAHPEVLQPLADRLAALKDEDFEYIVDTCLSVVKRRVGDSWMPVWVPQAHRATDAAMEDMSKILPLVVRVIVSSLGNFIGGLPTSLQAANKTAA